MDIGVEMVFGGTFDDDGRVDRHTAGNGSEGVEDPPARKETEDTQKGQDDFTGLHGTTKGGEDFGERKTREEVVQIEWAV